MFKNILILLVFFLLYCCHDINRPHQSVGKKFICDSLIFTRFLDDTVDLNVNTIKIIQYYDSIGCISCKMTLRDWDNWLYKCRIDSTLVPVDIVLIICTDAIEEVRSELEFNHFRHPVALIEDDNLMRSIGIDCTSCFMIDTNNRVMEYGSPLFDNKVEDAYLKCMKL